MSCVDNQEAESGQEVESDCNIWLKAWSQGPTAYCKTPITIRNQQSPTEYNHVGTKYLHTSHSKAPTCLSFEVGTTSSLPGTCVSVHMAA